jgi:hypothetical protein
MNPILIHPGFHKTGTTFLQDCVFSDSRFFNFLFSHEEIQKLFAGPHDFYFDQNQAESMLERARAKNTGDVVDVISSEILSGTIFDGSRDCVRLADRLARTCGEAKILLTVRAQPAIMKSIYLQYLKRGGRKSLDRFLHFRREPGYHWFSPKVLEFHSLAEHYAEKFGSENVLVLPQELLRRDRVSFLRLLFDFAGVKSNIDTTDLHYPESRGWSPPASGGPVLRVANLFRETPLNPEGVRGLNFLSDPLVALAYRWKFGEKAANARLEAVITKELGGCFGESNRRLQRFVPCDLSTLGYEMGE